MSGFCEVSHLKYEHAKFTKGARRPGHRRIRPHHLLHRADGHRQPAAAWTVDGVGVQRDIWECARLSRCHQAGPEATPTAINSSNSPCATDNGTRSGDTGYQRGTTGAVTASHATCETATAQPSRAACPGLILLPN